MLRHRLARLVHPALRAITGRVPSQCAVCRGWGASRVCDACVQRFAIDLPRCQVCALQVASVLVQRCGACVMHPPPFQRTIAALDYGFPWDGLLLALKFHDALDLAEALATRLAHAVVAGALPPPDLLVPMPSSPLRLRARGFNQAWEIARRLPADAQTCRDTGLLLHVREAPHQLSLPKDRRAANVRGVFAVEPLRRHEIAGQHVAIIDDVMTTGATAGEAARVLGEAGAASVQVWVVARARRPGS